MDRSDVFLSYRRKDVDFVKQVDQALKASGREVWVDWEDIPPGVEGFTDEIQRGIEGADAMIAVLSPSYLESEYCLMELKEALRLKKKIIPIVYQKFDPLPPPEGIGHINWVYFTPHAGQENTFEQSFPKVVQALEADFAHIREHTRLLLRAIDWDKHQRNSSFLLNGAEIDKAEAWQVAAGAKDPAPTQLHGEFILQSRKRQRQQQQRLMGAIGVLLVIAAIAAVIAVFQADAARKAQVAAEESEAIAHSIALAAAAQQPGNGHIALPLALEAIRYDDAPSEVFQTLANLAYEIGGLRLITDGGGLGGIILQPAVSPDGRYLVHGKQLITTTDGAVEREFSPVPSYSLAALFLPDNQHVLIAGDDDNVFSPTADTILMGLYDVTTGELVRKFDAEVGVAYLQLSTDGQTVISYHPNQKAVFWDVNTGEKLSEVPIHSYYSVISPDLKWLADYEETYITDENNPDALPITKYEVVLYKIDTLTEMSRITLRETASRMRFHPNNVELLVASNTGSLAAYSIADGQLLRNYNGHISGIVSLNFDPTGETFLAADSNKEVLLWDSDSAHIILRKGGHTAPLVYADYTLNGTRAVSVDQWNFTQVWDTLPGDVVQRTYTPGKFYGRVEYSPDGNYLLVVEYVENYDADGNYIPIYRLITYDANTQEFINQVELEKPIEEFDFSRGADQLQFASIHRVDDTGKTDIVVQTLNSDTQHILSLPENSYPYILRFIENGTQLATYETFFNQEGATIATYRVWDIASGEIVREWSEPLLVSGYALSHNGRYLALITAKSSEDQTLELSVYDMTTQQILFQQPADNWPTIKFSPNDATVYLMYLDPMNGYVLTEFKTEQGTQVRQVILDTSAPLGDFYFHPNGRYVFTIVPGGGGGGGEASPSGISLMSFGFQEPQVMLWDLNTGKMIRDYPTSDNGVTVRPDGRLFITSGMALTFWRLDTRDELIQWVCNNRTMTAFTADQRARYRIESSESLCATLDDG